MSDSLNLSLALGILSGAKVFDDATGLWRVYDDQGNELADPSGILLRGTHGVLLLQITPVAESQVVHGGGYEFLNPEWHKRPVPNRVRKVVQKVVKKAIKSSQKYPQDAQNSDWLSVWIAELKIALAEEKIAWNRFYSDLLQAQFNAQIAAQIRLQLELLGIYEQIEDEERAIVMFLFEL